MPKTKKKTKRYPSLAARAKSKKKKKSKGRPPLREFIELSGDEYALLRDAKYERPVLVRDRKGKKIAKRLFEFGLLEEHPNSSEGTMLVRQTELGIELARPISKKDFRRAEEEVRAADGAYDYDTASSIERSICVRVLVEVAAAHDANLLQGIADEALRFLRLPG